MSSLSLLTRALSRALLCVLSLMVSLSVSGCQLSAPEQEAKASLSVVSSFDDAPYHAPVELAKAREEVRFNQPSPPAPPPPSSSPSSQSAPMFPSGVSHGVGYGQNPQRRSKQRSKQRPKPRPTQQRKAQKKSPRQRRVARKPSVDQLTASLGDASVEQTARYGALGGTAVGRGGKAEAKKAEAQAEAFDFEDVSVGEPEPSDKDTLLSLSSVHDEKNNKLKEELEEEIEEELEPPREPAYELSVIGTLRERDAEGRSYDRAQTKAVSKRDSLPPPPAQPRALTALEEHLKQPKPVLSALWSKQGYFENTYLGGDLAFESKLKGLSTSEREALGLPGAQLKASALDTPNEEGVGLSVQMSEASVSGPRRVLMQVALQGSERYGWRRPPLSVVVVIDPLWLRQSALDLTDTLTPLLNALSPVDRVALLSPTLTLAELRGGEAARDAMIRASEQPQPALSEAWRAGSWLTAQLQQAGRSLEQAAADPHRAPGAQAVLMLCAEGCVDAREALSQEAHTLNLSGVLTTVMSAPSVGEGELWRVASAGHGGAWSLSALSVEELRRVTKGELERFSRVVARLLRLSVRFPKEVALINIIGSRMLSQARAAEVKAREVAMDKRLSARLGIQSDRGEDDEGVQVVIPAFYGGDRHFITFELWVEGPGEVAEITLKYKDMVRSLNATASAAAHLSSLPLKRGPVQREVLYVAAQQRLGVELKSKGNQSAQRYRLLSQLTELNPQSSLLKRLLERAPQGARLLGAALLGKGR